MLRKIHFAVDHYYHVYNRGVEKRDIFLDNTDYKRFIALLYLCNSNKPVDMRSHLYGGTNKGRSFAELFLSDRGTVLVDIGSYCLMPNHFHLLLKQKIENGISIFMKKLGTAYSMYFNKKNERSGILFQAKFQATIADTDEYLQYLFAYIHLNPIKLIMPSWKEGISKDYTRAKKFLDNYPWSSYSYFINKDIDNNNGSILNIKEFPNYFESDKEFSHFIDNFLHHKLHLSPTKDLPL